VLTVSGRTRFAVMALLLVLAIAAAFGHVVGNGFVPYDDDVYITANDGLRKGLTPEGLAWAATTFHAANWHPLTWVSHLLDVSLFGIDPAGHHLVGLLVHAAATLLLMLSIGMLTGQAGASFLAALIFGLHPLRVESVAWAAERKDLLSAFFWMAAIVAYVRYLEKPGWARYLGVCCCHAAGLLSKPMGVSLPLVLLILDGWPLGRFRFRAGRAVLEKVPLLAISAGSAVMTWLAQRSGGAVGLWEFIPWRYRLANAVQSTAVYLGQLFHPGDLAFFYPHPATGIDPRGALLAGLLLLAVSVAAVVLRWRFPAALAGWAWYLVTLLPVLGLVQVGAQARADRYTLLPQAGLLLILPGLWALLAARRRAQQGLAVALLGLAVAAGLATARQTLVWRDGVTLFTHALRVTEGNWLAHNSLGVALAARGETALALAHFGEAVRISPTFAKARRNLATALAELGRDREAAFQYRQVLEADPVDADSRLGLAAVLARTGDRAGAEREYRHALAIRPLDEAPLLGLGELLSADRPAEAEALYRRFLSSSPDAPRVLGGLALALVRQGREDAARELLERAVGLDPGYTEGMVNLGNLALGAGRPDLAAGYYRRALAIAPGMDVARRNLALIESVSPPAGAAGP
jgi:Flp pilus assembly protein TadD